MSSGRRLAPALALALAAAPVAAAAAADRGESAQLAVEAPAIAWSRDRLEIVVDQRGGLVGRKLMVTVHVDGGLIRGFPTDGERTTIRVEDLALDPGKHRLMIRSGTHVARDTFRYLPRTWAAGAAALVAAVAIAILLLRKKTTR